MGHTSTGGGEQPSSDPDGGLTGHCGGGQSGQKASAVLSGPWGHRSTWGRDPELEETLQQIPGTTSETRKRQCWEQLRSRAGPSGSQASGRGAQRRNSSGPALDLSCSSAFPISTAPGSVWVSVPAPAKRQTAAGLPASLPPPPQLSLLLVEFLHLRRTRKPNSSTFPGAVVDPQQRDGWRAGCPEQHTAILRV